MSDSITPAIERRDRNRREMRETILAAARKILVAEGVGALSMRAVARDIGYSPASLYEYFSSKAALCRALFFEGATGLSGRIAGSIETLPPTARAGERAAAMGRAYRDFALENRELYLLVFSTPVAGFVPDADDRREASGGYGHLVDAMRRGIESGELRAVDPEIAALASWSVVHGFIMLEILGYVGDGTRESTDPVFESLLVHVGNWRTADA